MMFPSVAYREQALSIEKFPDARLEVEIDDGKYRPNQ